MVTAMGRPCEGRQVRMTLTAEKIAKILIETRDGRLRLEIAAWLHDLDKASWPFMLYKWVEGQRSAPTGTSIAGGDSDIRYYSHRGYPSRSVNAVKYLWEEAWFGKNKPPFWEKPLGSLLQNKSAKVVLHRQDGKQSFLLEIDPDDEKATGKLADPFQLHHRYVELQNTPWPVFLLSAAFSGCDGIDSDFYKSQYGAPFNFGLDQTESPPMVATPFGLE